MKRREFMITTGLAAVPASLVSEAVAKVSSEDGLKLPEPGFYYVPNIEYSYSNERSSSLIYAKPLISPIFPAETMRYIHMPWIEKVIKPGSLIEVKLGCVEKVSLDAAFLEWNYIDKYAEVEISDTLQEAK